MSLDKAIEHGKEHRKPYRRSKRFDRTCRNHGSCGHCRGNRTYAGRHAEVVARADLAEIERGLTDACDGTCPICWPEAWVWNATTNRYEPRIIGEDGV